ncbi:uncharacterized protein LOC107271250 isoform X1 [Cephus cinctus]|uniref:Uncharacterized protein LOC107271250 isoform X1 n=1 Tax=Cephus cinctus TaxID=211228 RepID=A0AAJ7FPY6_CEPCN|nr:uncharacterized protein LOC107271250 isoform X1 [Cephus cinctus]
MVYAPNNRTTAESAVMARTTLRRIARHEEPEFSNASILNSMERFVRTVNEMEETILVPSRLLDLAVGDAADTITMKGKRGATIKDTMANTDLFRLYNIVNRTKVELLWSQEPEEDDIIADIEKEKRRPATLTRRPSTTSMQSIHSAASISSNASTTSSSSVSSSACDSDSDTGIENDSGLENEEPSDRLANIAADNFRRHLRGLHRSIERMTEAAAYLTLRYQADVGGQV